MIRGETHKGKSFLTERFLPIRVLRKSHGVETLLAEDLASKRRVIIKSADRATIDASTHLRLIHEADVLNRVSSPYLVPLMQVAEMDQMLYLVMPFVEGETLETRLDHGPLTPEGVVALGLSLLSALKELHAHGIFHRDVKPSNIVVEAGEKLERAVLIDFGLSPPGTLLPRSGDISGTSAIYLSPEQAGSLGGKTDHRCDLYSVGIVLYESLFGYPPFVSDDLGEVLRQHLSEAPMLETEGKPRDLLEIIRHLLEKNPNDRYQSAQAVLLDLYDVQEALKTGEPSSPLIVGLRDQRQTLTDPAFVGRDKELAELERHFKDTCAGRGGLVCLEGESGGGKTRLLTEFAKKIRPQRAHLFFGQGVDQVAQRPFELLVGLAAGVMTAATNEVTFLTQLGEGLGDHKDALFGAIPEFRALFGHTEMAPLGPENFGENRNLAALSHLLDHLATKDCPAVVILDDCQWADELTLKLLHFWCQRAKAANQANRVLIIASYRSEEVPGNHLLRKLNSMAHVTIPPLGEKSLRQFVSSMAGELPDESVSLVINLSAGSPFMARAVMQGLVEGRVLVQAEGKWKLEPSAFSEIRSSHRAANFLTRRFRLLPQSSLRVLQVAAILGKVFRVDIVEALIDNNVDFQDVLDDAKKRQMVWNRPDGEYAFVHDKLRETLLSMLTYDERRNLHRLAALTLEARSPGNTFELAYHFDEAGETIRALPYALKAADEARKRHSLEIAEKHYRIAARGVKPKDLKTRLRITEGLGDILMLRGNYEGAEHEFEQALQLTPDPIFESQLHMKLGELRFKKGDMRGAGEALERALRTVGASVPRSTSDYALRLAWEVLAQVAHTAFPRFFLARLKRPPTERELVVARILSRITYTYWFLKGRIPCAWSHLREMNLMERFAATPELAQAYSEHAPVMTILPHFKRGIEYARRSLEMRRRFGDLWGEGQSLHFYGVGLYADSRFHECIQFCVEAVRIMERTGDRWEVNTANWHIAYCRYRLGDLSEAVRIARQVYAEATEIGDFSSAGISLAVWAKASGGDVPSEFIDRALKHENFDAHTTAEVMQAKGIGHLRNGEYATAFEVFIRAHRFVKERGLRQEYVAPILPWALTAIRLNIENLTNYEPKLRARMIRRAWRLGHEAHRMAKDYRNNLPHVLRELGCLAALRGDFRTSKRHLNDSLLTAQKMESSCEVALSRVMRGKIGKSVGWTESRNDIAAGTQGLKQWEAEALLFENVRDIRATKKVTFSLIDRFDKLLALGRELATSQTREAIHAMVHQAAVELLRSQYCQILEVTGSDPNPSFRIVFGNASDPLNTDMLIDAMNQKRPLTLVSDDVMLSVQSGSDYRSALVCPIFVRGQCRYLFRVIHKQIHSLFSEDEERLAQFISSIASAAIENVEGLEQLRHRTESLTQSNIELERFAFVASHDLKEPLRIISLYTELLNRRDHATLAPDSVEYLSIITKNAGRMRELIDDLLRYSRVGNMESGFEPVSAGEAVQSAMENLQACLLETGGEIVFAGLPTVMANRQQLIMLFQNLVGNSIKFRGEAPPRVEIHAERQNSDWIFSLRDNGIGFEQEYAEQIFAIFKRLHARDEYPGTGIGLATCRRIVERHGGKIWAKSDPGQGCTFFFSLKPPTLH